MNYQYITIITVPVQLHACFHKTRHAVFVKKIKPMLHVFTSYEVTIHTPSKLRRDRIFGNDAACVAEYGLHSYRSARNRQHARPLCRAGCIVISENPQGFQTRSVRYISNPYNYVFIKRRCSLFFDNFTIKCNAKATLTLNFVLDKILQEMWTENGFVGAKGKRKVRIPAHLNYNIGLNS